ncbi:ROK family protein [Terrabacter aerolatus]|uniref:Transcriptional regulator n=1 Tax=Terrabacter aerolatus TaxID=422442 RepID=A0A512D612_9MICO|nr:ROK family protein [Terrabacter aerolatus]GEO31909.1 transcriptional regulator [Terrabacter aerolatus]
MILVADIGGTKIAAARADPDGVLCSNILEAPTPSKAGAATVVATTIELLQRLRTGHDTAVAVATAGVVDTKTGSILTATSSITGWGGTPLATLVGETLTLPTWVLGDGNAFGLGLAAEYGVNSLVALIAGTGIGGSLIVDGAPLTGAHHAGGHFGHIVSPQASGLPCPCGSTGHLEAVASGHGILAWYHANGGDPEVASTLELTTRTGDDLARAALQTGGAALGAGAAALVNALDPRLVVVCGSVAKAGGVWEAALRATYAATLMPALSQTPIAITASGPDTALRGAAHYALRRMNA